MAIAKSKIFYENRLKDGTPVASTTLAGNVLNLRDFRPYTLWQPSALPATVTIDSGSAKAFDYMLIWGHDIGTQGATVELRKSNDNFSADDNLVVTASPSDDAPFVLQFAQQSERYTRLRLHSGAGNPTIKIAAWGVALQMTSGVLEGFDPIGSKPMATVNRSVNGVPLGRVLDFEDWRRSLTFVNVPIAWVRQTWEPAWQSHLRSSPFVFAWDPGDHAEELVLVVADDFETPHLTPSHAELRFNVEGLRA